MKSKRTAIFFIFFLMLVGGMLQAEKSLELKRGEILEIGREDMLFVSITSVCEDKDLNFYVLDSKEHKIFKFSEDGKRMFSIGQKGQGPGDFQNPHFITISVKGHLIVADELYDISFLDRKGTFIKRVHLDGRLSLGFIGESLFYAWIWKPKSRTQVMVNSQNDILKTFFHVSKEDFSVSAPDDSGRLVMFNFSRAEYTPSLLFAHYGRYSAVSIGDTYDILILDEKGDVSSRIQRQVRPEKFHKKEREYLEEDIKRKGRNRGWPRSVIHKAIKSIPDHKVFIDRILLTEKLVFVFRISEDISDEESPVPVDMFSLTGEFLGPLKLEKKPICISEKHIYVVHTDVSGNLFLKRTEYQISGS